MQWASVEHGRMAVRGAPKRAGHALLSTFFSLFPTLEAHCIVATHCFLHSSPCSLLWTPTAKWPRTAFYILLPVLFFTKKAPLRIVVRNGAFGEKRFAPRCFHALLNALSSPRGALTAVFGMGTGVSPPPVARTKGIGSGRLDPGNGAVRACNIQQAQDGSLRGGFPPPSMLPARALPTGGGSRAGGVQTSRPIRSGMVNASRRLRIRPVKRVFFPRPSGTCVRDG